MEARVFDSAQLLKRQFEEASADWPNLTSVMILWPEADPPPEIPAALQPQYAVPLGRTHDTVGWKALYGQTLDMEGRRFRSGKCCILSYWRRFGAFAVPQQEVADPEEESKVNQRFKALAEYASRLIGDMGGAALSRETLAAGSYITRWQLAVHELEQSPQYPLDGNHSAVYEQLPDLFLSSAFAIAKLMHGDSKPPDTTKPKWDADTGRLTVGDKVAKQVKNMGQARNVVAVLNAFEEEGWPARIYDPNPAGRDPVRLNDTVRSLNANLEHLRFLSDGSGDGIRWEVA